MNNSKTKQLRQSNFELLRIAAMLMIISYHIVNNCMGQQMSNPAPNELVDNTVFHDAIFYKKLLIADTIETFGKIGDGIFILISGFFLGEGKPDVVKSVNKLLSQMAFATVILIVVSNLYHRIYPEKLVYLMGVNMFNSSWWYPGYYLGIIIIAALFLNGFLQKTDRKGHLTLLAITFAIGNLSWLGNIFSSLANDLRTLIIGIFLYSLGAYIRKYDPFKKVPLYIIISLIIGIYTLVWISSYNTTTWNIEIYLLTEPTDTFHQMITVYADYMIVPITVAICLFEITKRVHIPNSKIINYLSSASFMVFLIHCQDFSFRLIRERDWLFTLYNSKLDFCLNIIKYSISIYLCGTVIYVLYCITARGLSNFAKSCQNDDPRL